MTIGSALGTSNYGHNNAQIFLKLTNQIFKKFGIITAKLSKIQMVVMNKK